MQLKKWSQTCFEINQGDLQFSFLFDFDFEFDFNPDE